MIASALLFGAVFWIIGWFSQRRYFAFMNEQRKIYDAKGEAHEATGDANTKAIEENTAAIRDLIRKLDERTP